MVKTAASAGHHGERKAPGNPARRVERGAQKGVQGASDRASSRTREKILNAALRQFSRLGLAGARTGTIAKAAGVNKALLYYYFKDKNSLYQAALEQVAGKMVESAFASVDLGITPGESLLRLVLNHFDRIATQRQFQSLMQQEMVRFHRGESDAIPMLVRSFYGPLLKRIEAVVGAGIRSSELCAVDWMQILYAALGANVFYFLSAPVMRIAVPFEPLKASALRDRRKAAVEFLGNALFRDRSQGARVARRVLAEMPMPKAAARTSGLILGRRCS